MANCNRSCSGCSSGCNSCRSHGHSHCGNCGCSCHRCHANVNCCATRSNGCSVCSGCSGCSNHTGSVCSNCNRTGSGSCSSCNGCSRSGTCRSNHSYGCLSRISNGSNNCGNWNWRTACLGYDPLNICQNYEHFPFYSGPCGTVCPVRICNPCDPCCVDDCSDCCNDEDCCDECDDCSDTTCSLAVFSGCAPMEVAPGCRIPLRHAGGDGFLVADGGIRLLHGGLYLVTYTAHIPCHQYFSSRLYLTLNGETIAGSGQDVAKLSDGTSGGSTAQVLVRAEAGSLLCLESSGAFSLAASASAADVFTLSVLRACS